MEVAGLFCVSFWLAVLAVLTWQILQKVEAQRTEMSRLRMVLVKVLEALTKE